VLIPVLVILCWELSSEVCSHVGCHRHWLILEHTKQRLVWVVARQLLGPQGTLCGF
jgi:hypothetical protein